MTSALPEYVDSLPMFATDSHKEVNVLAHLSAGKGKVERGHLRAAREDTAHYLQVEHVI